MKTCVPFFFHGMSIISVVMAMLADGTEWATTALMIMWIIMMLSTISMLAFLILYYYGCTGFMSRFGVGETISEIERIRNLCHPLEKPSNLDDVAASAIVILKHKLPLKFYWRYKIGSVYTRPYYGKDDRMWPKCEYHAVVHIMTSHVRGDSVASIDFFDGGFAVSRRYNDNDVCNFYYCDPDCFIDFANWFLHK